MLIDKCHAPYHMKHSFDDMCVKYSLDDISIVPADSSDVCHRRECLVVDDNWKLPLFTAPMSTVVNSDTLSVFEQSNVNAILPRTEPIEVRLERSKKGWAAFSLNEFQEYFTQDKMLRSVHYVLIDIANGHMSVLRELIALCKRRNGNVVKIMAGNVANPATYQELSLAGADYVRLGIGSGDSCITSTNLGVHYPMASLIKECYEIKKSLINEHKLNGAKIIADGGFKNYRNIIKALALGADYVMLGRLFNECSDSAGEIVVVNDKQMKLFCGMASCDVQKEMSKKQTVPEGIIKYNEVKGTVKEFIHDFIGYLQSAMSYCNAKDLESFVGKQKFILLSQNSSQLFDR